ncbi:hypothetical protein AMECASPLE_009926 [Ameca splendens]|uniref:Uncharacterized protein n=1 Tax=Ameca splendens TaxID=208324 RepID=A0ABV0YBH8_9TELE
MLPLTALAPSLQVCLFPSPACLIDGGRQQFSVTVLPSVAGYLDLTLSPSIFAILDFDIGDLQTIWIKPGLTTLCSLELLAGGYFDGALPGTTTDHLKRTLSTLPHNNISNRTSELPQIVGTQETSPDTKRSTAVPTAHQAER